MNTLLEIEPQKVFAMPNSSIPDNEMKHISTLSDLADRELVAIIGWAKQVPGQDRIHHYIQFAETSLRLLNCQTGFCDLKKF